MKKTTILTCIIMVLLAACNMPTRSTTPGDVGAPQAAGPTTEPAGPTAEPAGLAMEPAGPAVEEAIMLLEPGPGSRVSSPLRLAGIADPTFEQTLVLRGLRPDGLALIAPLPISIQAPLGERGPFEIEVPFTVSQDEQVFLQVYAQSARDGGITHLASVAVILIAEGAEAIKPQGASPEQIVIEAPGPGVVVSGGVAHIEGFGVASFEGTFVLEVIDENGVVVGAQPVITDAPEMGLPGMFSADVSYVVLQPGPGRIVVRDPSPAFGGDVHLASVEVLLEP